jgi:hypothetical protein
MSASLRLVSVQDAYDDLLRRTLSKMPCDLGRLIYLASTRDYNSGRYHHEGLAARFHEDAARKALEVAHRQIFHQVAAYSLEELLCELDVYLKSTQESPEEVVSTWQKLEPYRIAVPTEVNATVARLFMSNIRLALAILRFRRETRPPRP